MLDIPLWGGHKEAPDPGHMLPGGHWKLWETMQCLQFSKKEKIRGGAWKPGSHPGSSFSWEVNGILTPR